MTTQIIFCKIITKSFHFHYHGEDDDQNSKAAALKAKVELDVLAYFDALYSLLKAKGIKHTHTLREDWRDMTYSFSFNDIEVFMGKEDFFDFVEAGHDVKICSRHEVSGAEIDLTNAAEKAQKIVDKLEELLKCSFPEVNYNNKCDVHVPGLGLLSLNRTMLLEDSCTDVLQSALNDGWRIIAACPQPDSRRPDYILGRYDPEYGGGEGAGALRRP